MKISQTFCAVHKGFWFKQIWKKKSKFVVQPTSIPPELQRKGVRIHDPVVELMQPHKNEVWIPPSDPRFMFPPREQDLPNWNETEAYTFSNGTRLWEGVKQAQILTNTIIHHGLPAGITARIDKHTMPNQDHLMQRNILQAHLWDPAKEKLPPRKKPDDISIWHYKTEFGIPLERSCHLLLHSILLQVSRYAATLNFNEALSRKIVEDHLLNSSWSFNGKPIFISTQCKYLVAGIQPLRRFTSDVDQQAPSKLPDLFPIAPTVDLDRSHIYVKEGSIGYSEDYSNRNHHLLMLCYPSDWTMDQRHANAIMISSAHCLLQSQTRRATKDLKDPISIMAVHTDGTSFGYTCFQLNTLEGGSTASVHNEAWIDSDKLFDKIVPRRAMLRNTKYENYNPNVIKKILALYLD